MKTAPHLDISGFAAKLDQTIASVDSLPLAQDARPEAAAVTTREAEGFWERLGAELLGELKQLVRIQKVDGADPALLSPSQAFFLRDSSEISHGEDVAAATRLISIETDADRRDVDFLGRQV